MPPFTTTAKALLDGDRVRLSRTRSPGFTPYAIIPFTTTAVDDGATTEEQYAAWKASAFFWVDCSVATPWQLW